MIDDGTILVMTLSFELVVPRCGNDDCSSPEVIQGIKRYEQITSGTKFQRESFVPIISRVIESNLPPLSYEKWVLTSMSTIT